MWVPEGYVVRSPPPAAHAGATAESALFAPWSMRACSPTLAGRSRSHILTASTTILHDNGDTTGSNPFPDCSTIPGNPSTQQCDQFSWGFHGEMRETTPLDAYLLHDIGTHPVSTAGCEAGPADPGRAKTCREVRAGLHGQGRVPGGVPVPGQQLVHPDVRQLGDAGKHIGEPESPEAMMLRLTGIDITVCRECGRGTLRRILILAPQLPTARRVAPTRPP